MNKLISNCKRKINKVQLIQQEPSMYAYEFFDQNDQSISNKTKVLMVYGQHARELLAPEIGLSFAKKICNDSNHQNPEILGDQFFKTGFLSMIVNANKGGRKIAENGNYCHRMNLNNVDLNRNYPLGWRKEQPDDKEYQTVPGKTFLSEKESNHLKSYLEKLLPHIVFDIHTGMKAGLFPFAYKNEKSYESKKCYFIKTL